MVIVKQRWSSDSQKSGMKNSFIVAVFALTGNTSFLHSFISVKMKCKSKHYSITSILCFKIQEKHKLPHILVLNRFVLTARSIKTRFQVYQLIALINIKV